MDKQVVMVVEDDASLCEAICDSLSQVGLKVVSCRNGEEAVRKLTLQVPHVMISDVQMPKMDGHALLKHMQQNYPQVPVVLMTAHGDVGEAVNVMKGGAADYLAKPFDNEQLVSKIHRFTRQGQENGNEPVAQDPNSKALLSLAYKVAQSDATVLISGESGSGKEVLARYIHDQSKRRDNCFIAINCAAIPDNMLEATLFGYEKGAFTGAIKSTPGKFEQAQNGTLLLDEISEMSLPLQAKLLRVLQEREVERLGGRQHIKLNVRVLATTNRDMQKTVADGDFREDLYYRLNVFPLSWKPLRERPLDIIPMANYLLEKHFDVADGAIPELSAGAVKTLQSYDWPGNAREMDNVIQRALILQTGDTIEEEDLHLDLKNSISEEVISKGAKAKAKAKALKTQEYQVILNILEEKNGNRKMACEELGISERTLRYKIAKMRDLGIAV